MKPQQHAPPDSARDEPGNEQPIGTIGRYEVLSLLGAGGMGTVYHARIPGPGKASKKVALKLLHPHLCQQAGFVDQFLGEMRLAMAMTHRNVVQTFDAGVDGQQYFMAMEFVDGSSLRALLKLLPDGGPLPLDLALFVVREICSALDYAHGLDLQLTGQTGGIIHRDVCPNNILLSRQGEVKLADFGVAKVVTHVEEQGSSTIRGKLRYMAPEQADGRAEPRSDIFSLGAVLHELIYSTPLRKKVPLERIASGDPDLLAPVPSRDDLPQPIKDLIRRCTHPDPAQRMGSATDLRAALDEQLHRLPGDATLDPHDGLAHFLADRLGPAPLSAPADQRASRMARLLLARDAAATTVGPPRPAEKPSPAERRRIGAPHAVAIGIVLLLVSAGVLWFASSLDEPAPKTAPDSGPIKDLSASMAHPDLSAHPRHDDKPRPAAKQRRRRRRGTLELNVVPWAYVYIDGRRVGETPIQNLRLPPGIHRVRLVNPALKARKTLKVRIRAGQTVRRVVTLP